MALIEIMNADGTINHKSGSPISGGAFVIASTPSLKTKALDKGVYSNPLIYTFSGGNASGFDSGSIATLVPQSIPASALKNKDGGSLVMRLGDFATMAASGTVGGTPTPITGPVEVDDAGQDKAKAA